MSPPAQGEYIVALRVHMVAYTMAFQLGVALSQLKRTGEAARCTNSRENKVLYTSLTRRYDFTRGTLR